MTPETMTPEFWQPLASMGIGGVLAGFCIWLLNKTWKDHSEMQREHLNIERGRTDMLVGVVKEVSTNITRNTVVTESFHRRLDKDEFEKMNGK